MPRGKRKSALQASEEQIEKINGDIAKYQAKIKDLEAKKKAMLDTKKQQEVEDLYAKIQQSGKSIKDVMELLSKS